jgi:hypothetical protein
MARFRSRLTDADSDAEETQTWLEFALRQVRSRTFSCHSSTCDRCTSFRALWRLMKILFLGNSHTYSNGVPYQCRELLACLGIKAAVSMIAQPGRSLAWHCDNPATRLALSYDSWDHIILQQCTHPFPGQAALFNAVKKLMSILTEVQSLWLYKTWCEKAKPENQIKIDRAFQYVSKAFEIPVIPVSNAWHLIERRDPGHELYAPDGKHAGCGGSYVAALCMARALSGKSVRGLPASLRYRNMLINRVPADAAALYQAAVDNAVKGVSR